MTDREVRLRALELALEHGEDLDVAAEWADFILGDAEDDSAAVAEVQTIVSRLHELLNGDEA